METHKNIKRCKKSGLPEINQTPKNIKNRDNSLDLSSHNLPTPKSGPPFTCPACKKNYKQHWTLTCHFRKQHLNQKLYKCTAPNCTKSFATSTEQKLHENNIHLNTEKARNKYPCKTCSETFNYSSDLADHVRFEHGPKEDRLHCDICDKYFKRRGVFSGHMKFHKGVEGKSYFCVYCDKSFFKKSGLKQHLLDFHLDQEADDIENYVQGDFQSLVHLMEVKVRKRTRIGSRFKNKNDESKIERNIFETDSKRKFSEKALFEFVCGAIGPSGPCNHVCTGTSGCHYIKKHISKKHAGYVYRFVAEEEDCLDLVISENTKLRNDGMDVGKKIDILLNSAYKNKKNSFSPG